MGAVPKRHLSVAHTAQLTSPICLTFDKSSCDFVYNLSSLLAGEVRTVMRDPGKYLNKMRVNSWLACLLACLNSVSPIQAQDAFLEDMELVGVGVGNLSSLADTFSRQTGGLSDGSRYSFGRYYTSDFKDLRFTMMSPINSNFGILWGFGTGEGGAKYHIEPSLKFGFLATEPVGDSGLLSLSVTTVLGGYFREGSCTANYGAIGGVQEVNCRMADSVLRPSETLDYLVNKPPSDQVSVSLRYRFQF